MSLQEAPGPSVKRQRILGPSDYMKHLYVCLMPHHSSSPPLWFSVHSIPVESLVAADSPPPSSSCEEQHNEQQLHLMSQVLYLEDVENVFSQRSGFVCLGDKLYIFSCQQLPDMKCLSKRGILPLFNNSARCFDFSGISNDVNPVYDPCHENEVNPSCKNGVHPSCKNEVTQLQLPSMAEGKFAPIVAHIDGLIYVLASGHLFDLIEPCFEVYDPRDNSWSVLPSPPLTVCTGLSCLSDFFFESYLVVKGKLCVSTLGYSLAFDTKTREWDGCELFCGFSHPPEFDIIYEGSKLEPIETAGPPFSFIRQAIPFGEDILICTVCIPELHVVAYQIVDGKVKKLQVLLGIEDGGGYENLVDLGGGYICYQNQTYSDQWLCDYSYLKFVTFKVSKIGGGRAVRDGSESEFLQCEHLNTLTQKINGEVTFFSVYSFPLQAGGGSARD